MRIYERAHAKINLVLDVLERRADGYHELRTVFQSLQLHDRLTLDKATDGSISLKCDNPVLPRGPDNLAWRAAVLLKELYNIKDGVKISLEKRIPVAAGLGGGSADAAAVLRGLVKLWGLPVEEEAVNDIAAQLGADVPFCLKGGTALGCGKGEKLQQLSPCPHFFVVMALPGLAVSTASVYSAFDPGRVKVRPDVDEMCRAIASQEKAAVQEALGNVLESVTFSLYPEVEKIKVKMSAHDPSLMSGSGPTIFALSEKKDDALRLLYFLRKEGVVGTLTETATKSELEVS